MKDETVTLPPAVRVPVLVLEDEGMFRSFLESWLDEHPRFALAGSFGSGEEALAALPSTRCEIIVVDLQLPGIDGLEFFRNARNLYPALRTLVLSSYVDPLALTRVRESGVDGYIEKDAPLSELTEALEALAEGRSHFSAKFRATLAREGSKAESVGKILSRREQEVLSHVLAGRTSRQAGELMGVSPRTVEFHRANLMAKLGAKNIAELAELALRAEK